MMKSVKFIFFEKQKENIMGLIAKKNGMITAKY